MGQVRADAQGPEAQTKSAPVLRPRPLSPHLQVWRWHVTMAASIATRATGVALYVGAVIAAAWALCLASGPGAYGTFMGVMASPLGLLVMFGLAVSTFYHLAAGLRHLVWDSGSGFLPKTANATATACFAFGILGAVVVFAFYFLMGAR